MTQLERVLAVLRGEPSDVMPWIADLTYWHSAHQQLGDIPERWQNGDGFHHLHEDLGVGVLCDYAVTGLRQLNRGAVRFNQHESNDCTTTSLITPVGSLTSRHKFLQASQCSACVEHFVKDVEDLRIVRYVAEQRDYEPDFEALVQSRDSWRGLGPIIVCPPRSPLSALYTEWAGVERTCYLLADHRCEVEETMGALAEAQTGALAILEQSPAEIIEFPDNLSAANQGSFFDKYLLPHYRPIVERLHAAGKFVGAHLDGALRGLLNRMPETGMDFIESITPAPVGDVPLSELRSLVPDKFVLVGGVPGASFAPPWDWPQLCAFVRELLQHHRGTPFILGSADQVPPDGEIEFVKRVTELLEDEGRS